MSWIGSEAIFYQNAKISNNFLKVYQENIMVIYTVLIVRYTQSHIIVRSTSKKQRTGV